MEEGRLARSIYEETNRCSFLEFYADELPCASMISSAHAPPIPRHYLQFPEWFQRKKKGSNPFASTNDFNKLPLKDGAKMVPLTPCDSGLTALILLIW